MLRDIDLVALRPDRIARRRRFQSRPGDRLGRGDIAIRNRSATQPVAGHSHALGEHAEQTSRNRPFVLVDRNRHQPQQADCLAPARRPTARHWHRARQGRRSSRRSWPNSPSRRGSVRAAQCKARQQVPPTASTDQPQQPFDDLQYDPHSSRPLLLALCFPQIEALVERRQPNINHDQSSPDRLDDPVG